MKQSLDDINITERNNELNIAMVPLIVPPFTFTSEAVHDEVCPTATGYRRPIYSCQISNPANRQVSHRLDFYRQRYSHYYNKWYDPIKVDGTCSSPSIELALAPGESFNYHFDGYRCLEEPCGDPDNWGCDPGIPQNSTVYFWLQDEEGNRSMGVSVFRGE